MANYCNHYCKLTATTTSYRAIALQPDCHSLSKRAVQQCVQRNKNAMQQLETCLYDGAANLLKSQIMRDTQHLTASVLSHDLLKTKLPPQCRLGTLLLATAVYCGTFSNSEKGLWLL